MYLQVGDHPTYCYTGGKVFDAAQPTVIFIHGVLNDHSVWGLQSRYFAHHGWNVLAVDLPGHCRSGGDAPESVEQAADFIAALMDAAGIDRAALVGHSWGSLIALEAAGVLGKRVSHLALIGTAFPMPVSPALLDAARTDPQRAIHLINVFSRSTLAPPPSAFGPGTWVWGASVALNRRVLASNPAVNLLHRGFTACDRYRNGEVAIGRTDCPILFLLGAQDQMTRPADAQRLIDCAAANSNKVKTVRLPVGHHLMNEAPEETLAALKNFLA